MTCPHCGQPCDETKPLCGSCGGMVCADGSTAPSPEQCGRVKDTLRLLSASPVCLIGLIAFTLSRGAVAVTPLLLRDLIFSVFETLFSGYGGLMAGSYDMYAAVLTDRRFALVTSIPSLLLCAGLWLVFVAMRRKRTSAVGLAIIEILTLLSLVGTFFCGFLPALGVTMMAVADYSADPSAHYFGIPIGYILTVALLLTVVTITAFVYYLKFLKTISAISKAIQKGIPNGGVSVFVIVIGWILGIGFAASAILGALFHPILILPLGLSAAAYSSFALFLAKYKAAMKKLST